MGEGSFSSHVHEYLYLTRRTRVRHLGDRLQGSGLVVEFTRVGSIKDILSSVVGLSQVCVSGMFAQVK